MDARTFDKAKLLTRRVTEGPRRATRRSSDAALMGCGIVFDVAEIFKRTAYNADLKPGGLDVARNMFECGGLPSQMQAIEGGKGVVGGMERRED